ncbi:MAG: hypothetical protein NT154_09410 [Verrucomicrobia bacterium]|nr:hypothetical protein [Verrucomicrobiota bacterium]
MKNKLKSVKMGSKTAATSQAKTAQSRANVRPEFPSPTIALFPEGDDGTSEEIIELSPEEHAVLKRAAFPEANGLLMFMANAALEKAGSPGGPVTCVCILHNGSKVARVYFPSHDFARFERVASKKGISLQKFFCKAIRNFIRSQTVRRAA